eukprot:1354467-Amphidinium_carterae.1
MPPFKISPLLSLLEGHQYPPLLECCSLTNDVHSCRCSLPKPGKNGSIAASAMTASDHNGLSVAAPKRVLAPLMTCIRKCEMLEAAGKQFPQRFPVSYTSAKTGYLTEVCQGVGSLNVKALLARRRKLDRTKGNVTPRVAQIISVKQTDGPLLPNCSSYPRGDGVVSP